MSHTLVDMEIIVTGLCALCEVRTEADETTEYQACDNNVARPDISTSSTETEETIFPAESMCCVRSAIRFWRSSGEVREYCICRMTCT